MPHIAVVVVTYNRCALLLECLAALAAQSHAATRIHIIDNASSDGTAEALRAAGWLARAEVDYQCLADNRGGAGGFAVGLERAIADGADWVWMMDDDARPACDALQALLAVAPEPRNVYGSTAVAGERLAWAMTLTADGRRLHSLAELPAEADVEFLPFLGIFVHRELVARIGLPDAEFFLAADDLEYCLRACAAGARLRMVAASRIHHPPSTSYRFALPGKTLHCLALPPWKRYYDTRNRIFVARRHFGARLYRETLPSIAARLLAALLNEPRRAAQCWATLAGVVDGLAGRGGRRHQRWRLGA
ncbi:MAG: glycosyltransferase [Proteobacteria bacterium]|jgi:rhamnopyranosyl-N-acetylglucosaminyl-diphospho-decaprenol beta-1,3/1,4-galactofuranosyltransferase|nr:glycosyltransferase [Pseudomonadota bacterium]